MTPTQLDAFEREMNKIRLTLGATALINPPARATWGALKETYALVSQSLQAMQIAAKWGSRKGVRARREFDRAMESAGMKRKLAWDHNPARPAGSKSRF